jgi:hypothetical protein
MTVRAWSDSRSAVPGTARARLRTSGDRRPPRHDWHQRLARLSWWQLTTRPPRASTDGWGSGSQLPVEIRGVIGGAGGADGGRCGDT